LKKRKNYAVQEDTLTREKTLRGQLYTGGFFLNLFAARD
jgi:hypothetical protein